MNKQLIGFNSEIKILDEQNRIIQMIGSTQNADRVGDRMIMSGCDLSNYKKNPVILANHSYGNGEKPTCIGKALDVQILGTQLIFKIQFAETENAKDWFNLYANGYMNASSVGFAPTKYTPNTYGGYDYEEWQLLELSLVAVPCNPECVQRAFDDGKISKAFFDAINKESEVENMKTEEVQALIEKSVKAAVKTLEDSHKEELAAKVKEIEGLNEKVKELESLVNEKAGAKLSQSTCDTLTKACEGIAEHVKNIKGLIDVVNTQETDGDGDDGDTKDYSQEDINKAVKANIEKILGGNE